MSSVTLPCPVCFKTYTWRLYLPNLWIFVDLQQWLRLRLRFRFSGTSLHLVEALRLLLTLYIGMVVLSEEANQETYLQPLSRWLHSIWLVGSHEATHISLQYPLQTTSVKVQTQLLLDFKQHRRLDFHLQLQDSQWILPRASWLDGQRQLMTVVLRRLLITKSGLITVWELATRWL
jgi:hypothetical protein